MQRDIRLVAHRGGLYYRPENTLAAFEYIIERGINWIEVDVRLTGDGIPVLFHDEQVQVPGSGYRQIRELVKSDLEVIDVGGGERMPTLRETLEKFRDRTSFDLELKELDAVEKVVNLIREFDLLEKSIITSFMPETLQKTGELLPEIGRGFLLDRLTGRLVDGKRVVRTARLLECEYLLPHYKLLTKEWTAEAHSQGLKVLPWTVNHLSEAKRLLKFGVDGFVVCDWDVR